MNRPEPTSPAPASAPVPARKTASRAALAVAGAILFTPLALTLADRPVAPFGIPSVVLYVFGAWLAGIVLTARVAR